MAKTYLVSVVLASAVLFGITSFVGAELIITPVDPRTEADIQTDASASGKIDTKNNSLDAKINTNASVQTGNNDKDSGQDSKDKSEKLLPTVNKRNGEAKVIVKGWDPAKKEQIESRIKAEMESKTEIQSVDITENKVTVAYSVPGKLFGFIPFGMVMRVIADANANVHINFPWYSFLVKSDVSGDVKVKANQILQYNESDWELLKSKPSEDRQLEIFLNISTKMHDMAKSVIQNIRA